MGSGSSSTLGGESNEVLFVDPTSPLIHQAAAFGNVEDLAHELAVGWHVDMTDNYGRTALHHAALNGNLDACSFLIDRGARLDARVSRLFKILRRVWGTVFGTNL
jgi:ankyrin repeat protein